VTELEIKRKATDLLQKERYQEAIEEYEKLLERTKKPNPAILNLIGDIHIKQGDFQRGFERYINASRVYAEEGLYHNGIAVCKKGLRLDADQTEVYGMLGQLYANQGLGMDCVKFLNEYARRKEDDDEFAAALAAFAEACEILSEFPEVHVAYGELLEKGGRDEDAAACFEKAARACSERSQHDEAVKLTQRARELGGGSSARSEEDDDPVSGVREMMNLRSLDESPAPPARLAFTVEDPWSVFDPANHPEIPPPPPLPPRPGMRPPAPAPAAEEPLEIELASPPSAMPRLPVDEVDAPPAPGLPVGEVETGPDVHGLSGVVMPPTGPSETGEPAGETEDAPALQDFFQSSAAQPTEGGSERAVIVGDDFELVREGGDVYEVIKDFRDATMDLLDLDDYQAHYDLGTTYMEMELFDEAAMEFEISARGPEWALSSREMLGYCFLRKGQIDLAIRELEKGLQIEGVDERDKLGLLYNLGVACRVLDRESEAIEYFRRILEIDPDFRDARSRLERLVENSA